MYNIPTLKGEQAAGQGRKTSYHIPTIYFTIPYHTILYHTVPYLTIPYHSVPTTYLNCRVYRQVGETNTLEILTHWDIFLKWYGGYHLPVHPTV